MGIMMFVGFVAFVCAVVYLTAGLVTNWMDDKAVRTLAEFAVLLSLISGIIGLGGFLHAANH